MIDGVEPEVWGKRTENDWMLMLVGTYWLVYFVVHQQEFTDVEKRCLAERFILKRFI